MRIWLRGTMCRRILYGLGCVRLDWSKTHLHWVFVWPQCGLETMKEHWATSTLAQGQTRGSKQSYRKCFVNMWCWILKRFILLDEKFYSYSPNDKDILGVRLVRESKQIIQKDICSNRKYNKSKMENNHNESINSSTLDKQMGNNIKPVEFDLKRPKITRTRLSLWWNQMWLVATESSTGVSIIRKK